MRRRGFTVVELLLVVAFVGIFLAIAGRFILKGGESKKKVLDAAFAWARNVQTPRSAVTIECARRDSDGDGYVSCTVFVKDNDSVKTYPIECADTWTLNDGCRIPKARFVTP